MLTVTDNGGFRKLARAVKQAGPEVEKQLKESNQKVGQVVIDSAKSKASGRGGVAVKAAPSLRAAKQGARVQVTLGGARFPWALGAEFGSKRYKQFAQWRGRVSADAFGGNWGYFLGPGIRDSKQEVLATWERGMDEVLRQAFPPQM